MLDSGNIRRVKFKPLKVSCGATDCPSGLHCYRKNGTLPKAEQRPDGECWDCGEADIDWERIHRLDPTDTPHLFEKLKTELIRHTFWEYDVHLDVTACNHARRKGRNGMLDATRHRLKKYLKNLIAFDGQQTPQHSNAIYYAQHATATCCRRCIEYWYGIDKGAELSGNQLSYFTDLCMFYIDEKLPDLTANGEYVPPRSTPRG